MVVLHIGKIKDNSTSGVNVVVPQHIIEQSKYATVALFNLADYNAVDKLTLPFSGIDNIPNNLPKPFDRPDLVVFHEVNNKENIKIYPKLLKAGIPYIIIPHGEITVRALSKKWLKKKIAYILLFNKFIKKSISVQCLSMQELQGINIKCNKFVATNGTTIPAVKKENFQTKPSKVVYIGRLDMYHKGLDIMVDAVSMLADYFRVNSISLAIYGPEILRRRVALQNYIDSKGLADIITINDPIFGEEKENILINSDVFIQTSRFEGMPLGVQEAMAYGMPVVITGGTNIPAMQGAEDATFACDNNAESVASALRDALEDDARRMHKGSLARQFAENNFAWDIVAKTTIDKYSMFVNNATKGNMN